MYCTMFMTIFKADICVFVHRSASLVNRKHIHERKWSKRETPKLTDFFIYLLDFVIQLMEMSATFSYQVLKLMADVKTFLPCYILAILYHSL